jgi:hypothetical protein
MFIPWRRLSARRTKSPSEHALGFLRQLSLPDYDAIPVCETWKVIAQRHCGTSLLGGNDENDAVHNPCS